MKIKAIKTRVFKEKENLVSFILEYVKKLPENSILVVTSKIVALSEGRTAVVRSEKEKIKLIKKESDFAMETEHVWLTIKDGNVMASAGFDESNADGKVILLPKDSFKNASKIRRELKDKFNLNNLGVIVTDSRLLPLRSGVVGVALGYAGFKGKKDYVGKKDIFGRVLKFSRTDVADALATSAVLVMGEGDERMPLALINEAPVEYTEKVNRNELIIDPREDIYKPLFENL